MLPEIPVVGSVAITSNWTSGAWSEVVVKRPLFGSMLTFGTVWGLVYQCDRIRQVKLLSVGGARSHKLRAAAIGDVVEAVNGSDLNRGQAAKRSPRGWRFR